MRRRCARRPLAKTQQRNLYFRQVAPHITTSSLFDVVIATNQKRTHIQAKAESSHQISPQVRNLRHCIPHASSRVTIAARVSKLTRVSRSQIPQSSQFFTYVNMQFTKLLIAAAAFVVANAQVEFTMNADFFATSYTAGVSVMNLTWHLNSGPVTIKLVTGPATNLSLVEAIMSTDFYTLLGHC
jgi:hypothetical protein